LIRSFNGLITLWFGLLAFRAVLPDLPLRPKYAGVAGRIDSALMILTVSLLIARVLIALVRSRSDDKGSPVTSITLIENLTRIVIYVIGALFVFRTFGIAVTPILTALGVGGLAVALALQDTLSNLFAGVYIILSKNLSVGDYVRIEGGHEGVIRDIAWRVTTLETIGQTLVIIPNNKISTGIVTNFDKPEHNSDLLIPFTIDNASQNPKAFEDRALKAVNRVSERFADNILASHLEYTSWSSGHTKLQLVLRLRDFTKQNEIRDAVLREMLP
jgi:small-conductance mechanosensitive channel